MTNTALAAQAVQSIAEDGNVSITQQQRRLSHVHAQQSPFPAGGGCVAALCPAGRVDGPAAALALGWRPACGCGCG